MRSASEAAQSETLSTETIVGWSCLLMILVSMSIVTARLCDAPALRSANDRSRWCTVWSLVERNTYQIDEIRQRPGWDTIDLVRHDEHFYSSKPPLLPRIVAEIYRAVRFLTGWTLLDRTEWVARCILFLINILPMTLGLWMFSRLIREHCANPFGQLFIVASACFATMLLPYLTVFNNHNVAASCFLISIPLAIRCLSPDQRTNWRFALSGLLMSFGICNELPAALLGLGTFAILMSVSPKQTLAFFVTAALVPIIAFFATNYSATGSYKPFYAAYGTKTYEFVYEGVPSYWSDPKGIDSNRDSTPIYLMHCTIGHHGILSLTPIYLLTLLGWCLPATYRDSRLRWFQVMGSVLTFATLGFFLTRTENYNYSGMSIALRWMLWLTPFWLLAMVSVFANCGRAMWFRGLSVVLLCVSIFSAWYPLNSPWAQSWIYALMNQAKWIDYSDPRPVFQKKHYTWIGQLPTGELQPEYWVRFESTSPSGRLEQIELKDAGPQGEGRRLIRVVRSTAGQTVSDMTYLFDTTRFAGGQSVDEFLISRENGDAITDDDLEFFRGMPRKMQYFSSRIRYEKTALRKDAFRTHVGYTNTKDKISPELTVTISRDVWYTEEIPFGVLKWDESVKDGATGTPITTQHWSPVQAGKFLERAQKPEF